MATKYWEDLESARTATTRRWDAIVARSDVVVARTEGGQLVKWSGGEPNSPEDYAALTLLHAHRLWVARSRVADLADRLRERGARALISAEDARDGERSVGLYADQHLRGLNEYLQFGSGYAARAGWVLFDLAEGAADGRFDLLSTLNDREFAGVGPSLLFTHAGWDLGPFDNPRPSAGGGFAPRDPNAGEGVTVLVSDSGWVPSTTPGGGFDGLTPNDDTENPFGGGLIAEAAYHGMFAGQLVRQIAPGAKVIESSVMMPGDRHLVDEAELLADLVRGIEAFHDTKLVVNWSIAGHSGDLPTGPFDAVVTKLLDEHKELIIVVSAGNDRVNCCNVRPAGLSHPRLVAVGAVRQPKVWDPTGVPTPAGFSNYGCPVRVWTIGEHVVAEFLTGTASWNDDSGVPVHFNGHASWSGTSFAAPIIAAKIAVEFASVDALQAIRMVAPPQSDWNANTMLVKYYGSTAPYLAP